ncbi:hypothetical protein CH300_05065 [Rhodococcus sp. 15-1154-1]|nr:substrate-binding domain-containing protein [Rhodococcus sp. 15-1154-1]OZF07787.1 hypothetical protein CH300_05065 [Rhodococcus sp. 15-1154-1]
MRSSATLPLRRKGAGSRRARYAAALAAMALVAGCSSTTAGSNGSGDSVDPVSSDIATPEATQATIDKAFLQPVTADSLDPTILNTMAVASVPLTSEQDATFAQCMQSNVCETGRGSLTVAFANDNVNPWRSIFRGEVTAQAIASPQVAKIVYNSSTDVAGFLANFQSLVAQRVDIIVLNSIYGGAVGPVLQQAKDAGILVVEAHTPLPDDVVGSVAAQVVPDLCQTYTEAGEAIAATDAPNKSYAMYTGVPGNSNAATWQPCFERSMQAAGWTRALEGFTQWTPQGTAQAANALLSSGTTPGAIVYDYTPEDLVRPFVDRGQTPPVVMSDVVNQSWLTAFTEARDANLNPTSFVTNSQVWIGRIAVTAGIMLRAGQEVSPQMTSPNPVVPLDDVLQNADPSIPASTPVPTLLTPAQIALALSAS